MSEHKCTAIQIAEILPHPNADRLEIVPVGGWQAVIKKGQFAAGDTAIYIEPDYVVPTNRSCFEFLARDGKTGHRLKAVRLRGALSFGLLIPVPEELGTVAPGDDVMARLGITRYEPQIKIATSDALPEIEWPKTFASKFDLESYQRYPDLLVAGEQVIVTEKVDGGNARYLFLDGTFYMGSRTQWLKPDVSHHWKQACDDDPRIEAWCRTNPGVVLYGEVYGPVQSLRYGRDQGRAGFVAFAALDAGIWWNLERLMADFTIPLVPFVYMGPWNPDAVLPRAEEDSTVPGAPKGHIREGLVIVPAQERRDMTIGRVALKYVSNRFWTS